MNARDLKLLTVFALAVTATASGCASPLLTQPAQVATLGDGQNRWSVQSAEHGSNQIYIASCANDGAGQRIETARATASLLTAKFNVRTIFLPDCAIARDQSVLNNVSWRNYVRGEERSVTQASVISKANAP